MSTYDDASLIYYPSGYKAGKAYSLKPTDGSGDLTFTRASTATRVNESGLIESVATGVPRIDYTGGGCGKLLLEPQRTNSLINSENFSGWTPLQSVVSNTTETNPMGINSSYLVVDNNTGGGITNSAGIQLNGVAISPSTQYTFSVFFKPNPNSQVSIGTYNDDALRGGSFDVTTGIFTPINSEIGSIEPYINGWYKISVTWVSGTDISIGIRLSFLGIIKNGTNKFYAFGAQLEAGSYPTSYIPTSGTAVTRTQDSANKTGISSLINSTEGVLYAELAALTNGSGSRYLALSNSTNNERVTLQISSLTNIKSIVIVGGVEILNLTATVASAEDFNKIAIRYKANDYAFYVNGVLINTSTSPLIFSASTLNTLTFSAGSVSSFISEIKSRAIMVFPTALSDAELIALTTL